MDNLDETILASLCPDPVIGADGNGIVNVFNAAAEKLLGFSASEVVGKKSVAEIYLSLEHARDIKRLMFSEDFGPVGTVEGYEAQLLCSDGESIPVRLSATIVDESEGSSIGFFHDLTERQNLEKQLHKLSVTDELTGLFNQRHFYKVMAKEIERAKRYEHPLSIICFDLDNFKKINDSLGHLEGDRVLRMVGDVLGETLRSCDVAVRYGGDEFMVLLPETHLKDAARTSERLRSMFNKKCPFSIDNAADSIVTVSMSLGVTETDGTENTDQIVQRADLAMYESKSFGGNSTVKIQQHIGNMVQKEDL